MAAAFSHHHHNQHQLITSPSDHLDLLTSPLSDTFSDHHHFQYQYSAGFVDTNLIFNDPPFGCFQDLIDPTSNNSTRDAGVVQDTLSCIIDQATTPPSAPPDDSFPNTGTDEDHLSNSLTVKQMYSHGCSQQKGLKRNPSRPSANSVNTKNVRGGKKQRKRNYSKLGGIKVGADEDDKDQEMKINNCLPPRVASCREIEPGYIHVRARRGQATDSHSLAERVRREKISERMKVLQALVPGCDKVTGKAMMLDEIINYVQSLQTQVEFLSMKLVSLSPMVYSYSNGDIGMEQDSVPSTMISHQDQYLPMLEQCNSSPPPSVVYKSPSFFLNQQQENNNNKDVWCSIMS